MQPLRFRVNTPSVASQVIDGEAVLINFESGAYYSAGRAGAVVLELLAARPTISDLAAYVVTTHEGDPAQIEAAVRGFLSRLEAESLIVPCSAQEPAASLPDPATIVRRPFETPSLEKHDDLEDILLLDPIHDGDHPAWPVRQSSTPTAET